MAHTVITELEDVREDGDQDEFYDVNDSVLGEPTSDPRTPEVDTEAFHDAVDDTCKELDDHGLDMRQTQHSPEPSSHSALDGAARAQPSFSSWGEIPGSEVEHPSYQSQPSTSGGPADIVSPESQAEQPGAETGEEVQEAEPLSEEEQQRLTEEAEAEKLAGNELYSAGQYEEALAKYMRALEIVPGSAAQRAVYFANCAACHMNLEDHGAAARDCTAALEIQPEYVKALVRRCTAYEKLDDLERAFADAQKVVSLDPKNAHMIKTVARLEPIVNERREKLKEEMLGKLKELGNTVLGKFGMSLDNFNAVKDPNTGGYSIQFKQ